MDPISLIVAALAVVGKETTSLVVKDIYPKFKALLEKKFAATDEARLILGKHADNPRNWDGPMRELLQESHADRDAELLEAAAKLLAEADPSGAARGKYTIAHAEQCAIGDHATVNIGVPPRRD